MTLPILPEGPGCGRAQELRRAAWRGRERDLRRGSCRSRRAGVSPARNVAWSLYKVERRYQWYNSDGRWGYEPVKSTRRVADGRIAVAPDGPARISAPVEWGTYRLDVSAPDLGETAQTSLSFTVGWSGDQTADTPDLLDMNLDKASYRAGETMQLRLNPRFKGKATLAVVSDRVHDIRVVDVAAAGTDVSLPVQAAWGPGAYVVAIAHRPLDQAAKRMPGRSLGTAWFEIDRDSRELHVTLNAPDKIRPRGSLSLPIKVAGLAPGEEARITVAAVDVGILNLTRYEAPDPLDLFLRAEAALVGDPRSLRLSHRRHAGHARRDPFGRRHGAEGARRHSADAGAAGAVLRRGEGGGGRIRATWISTFPPSTARCGSWPSPGRRTASAVRAPT